jgi:hypothetical protein
VRPRSREQPVRLHQPLRGGEESSSPVAIMTAITPPIGNARPLRSRRPGRLPLFGRGARLGSKHRRDRHEAATCLG